METVGLLTVGVLPAFETLVGVLFRNLSKLCLLTLIIGLLDNALVKGDLVDGERSFFILSLPEKSGLLSPSFDGESDFLSR